MNFFILALYIPIIGRSVEPSHGMKWFLLTALDTWMSVVWISWSQYERGSHCPLVLIVPLLLLTSVKLWQLYLDWFQSPLLKNVRMVLETPSLIFYSVRLDIPFFGNLFCSICYHKIKINSCLYTQNSGTCLYTWNSGRVCST